MIRKILSPVLLLLAIGLSFQCKKNNNPQVLTGKLVIAGPCANYVIQVLRGPIDSSRLVKRWTNPDNDSVYTNVFAVSNSCTFAGSGVTKGQVFQFEFDSNPPAQNCLRCDIAVSLPPVSNAVKNTAAINM
jgi:hypothetical protein